MATKTATIARPATGETLRGKQKEKDVRMSNIIAAKGTYVLPTLLQQAPLALQVLPRRLVSERRIA